jgi:lipid-binding SYLF domain-containing protein
MKHTLCRSALGLLLLAAGALALTAFGADDELAAEAQKAVKTLQSADSTLTNLFTDAAGFAVFPSVGKGGLIFGGEHGKGIVYEKGKPIGEVTLTEINVGPQVGGQSFYEVIFFETTEALANFKQSNFEMSAEVSAVAASEGAALNAKYRNGVVVFTLARTGLMVQASIGGQKFKYKPLN